MVNGMKFTADGTNIITYGTDCRLRLWDAFSGKNMLTNYGKLFNDSSKCVKLTLTDGCQPELIFVPEDSNIRSLNLLTGETIATLRGHYNQINCCEYHPLYQELYSGANDRNILIWTADSESDSVYEDSLRDSACKLKGKSGFVRKISAVQDAWSSDED